MERVRVLARQVKAREAYSLRGEQHAKGMKEHLNTNLARFGIQVKRCIITSVVLDEEVAMSMQDKTIFQFKNTLERKKFAFEQRIKNDMEEVTKARQVKEEERKDTQEQANLAQMKKSKEIESIKAKISRVTAEWKARTEALISSIDAETDLKYNEIVAEAKLTENKIKEEAQAKAAEIIAEADAYKATVIANAQKEAAPLIAQAVELEGQAQSKLLKSFVAKRRHEEILQKIEAVSSFANNNKAVVFGDQGNNLLAQIESYNMVNAK
jgi:regulator of protease activity HflC (stomatin/prohibitin superfamily)